MAGGNKEHKMLFDLQGGHRRKVVKVVYAVLAVLMGLSLFLVVGGLNIAELFNSNGGVGNPAQTYEEQAERIEVKLKKDPENPDLLLSLTRAQVNAGNVSIQEETSGERVLTPEAQQAYQEADQSWSEYLKATDEPNSSLAQLIAPMMVTLAETSTSYPQADQRIAAAAEAEKIVAEDRPSVSSLTTLAFYTYFTGDLKAAEKARAEAIKIAKTKSEREAIDKQLDEYKKNAATFVAAKEKAEKEQKASGGAGAPESLENPLSPTLGSGGLGE